MRISHKLDFYHLNVERSWASPLGETKSLNYQTSHEVFYSIIRGTLAT